MGMARGPSALAEAGRRVCTTSGRRVLEGLYTSQGFFLSPGGSGLTGSPGTLRDHPGTQRRGHFLCIAQACKVGQVSPHTWGRAEGEAGSLEYANHASIRKTEAQTFTCPLPLEILCLASDPQYPAQDGMENPEDPPAGPF